MTAPKRKKPGKRKHPQTAPHIWKRAFIAAFRRSGNVTVAAAAAKIHRSTPIERRRTDPKFAAAWEDARDEAADWLECEARRRAIEGWLEPVFGSGGTGVGTVEVGAIRRFSDTLLIFLMKGAAPEKYRERFQVSHDSDTILVLEDANWYRTTDNAASAATASGSDSA